MASSYVIDTARAPGRAAAKVTQRSGTYSGKGILTAELLAGFALVLIRLVADYEVQEDGTVKGNVGHPAGQYGPLPILTGLIISFFFLSFLAVAGGTRAKIAGITGGCIILTLGVKSYTEIETVSRTFGSIGSVTSSGTSGTENTAPSAAQAAAAAAAAGAGGSTSTSGTKSTSAASNALGAWERLVSNISDTTLYGISYHAIGATLDLIFAAADGDKAGASSLFSAVKNDFSSALSEFKSFLGGGL